MWFPHVTNSFPSPQGPNAVAQQQRVLPPVPPAAAKPRAREGVQSQLARQPGEKKRCTSANLLQWPAETMNFEFWACSILWKRQTRSEDISQG